MPLQIVTENNKKFLFETNLDLPKMINKVKELNENKENFKIYEVAINLKNFTVDEENKVELEVIIDDELETEETIKVINFYQKIRNVNRKDLKIFVSSKKIIKPIKLLKENQDKLKELNYDSIDKIILSWSKVYKKRQKTIHEDITVIFQNKEEEKEWIKHESKRIRTF